MAMRKVLGLLCWFFGSVELLWAQADHVLISEIQVAATSDADSEFVELYNPMSTAVNLEGWRLGRESSSGATQTHLVNALPAVSIAPYGFLLVSPKPSVNGVSRDVAYTSTTSRVASNNTIILFSDAGLTVDKVGLGTAADREGVAAGNPATNGSVERKASASSTASTLGPGGAEEFAGNGYDSGDNSADFVQQTISRAQNASSPAETGGAVPVELSTFGGRIVEDGVLLEWTTESETENLGFHVYRSNVSEGDFSRLTTELIPGAGTTAVQQRYSYLDRSAGNGGWYYKIADVDFQGNYRFHGPIHVLSTRGGWPLEPGKGPLGFALEQNYPNPFNSHTQLSYYLATGGDVELTVYNLLGQPVRTLVHGMQPTGLHNTSWDGADALGVPVAAGAYFCELKMGAQRLLRKMIFRRGAK